LLFRASALEVCYDNVLYKSTFDIDIDIAIGRVISVVLPVLHLKSYHCVLTIGRWNAG